MRLGAFVNICKKCVLTAPLEGPKTRKLPLGGERDLRFLMFCFQQIYLFVYMFYIYSSLSEILDEEVDYGSYGVDAFSLTDLDHAWSIYMTNDR